MPGGEISWTSAGTPPLQDLPDNIVTPSDQVVQELTPISAGVLSGPVCPRDQVAFEETLCIIEKEMFGEIRAPWSHGMRRTDWLAGHLTRIENLETICGVPFIAGQNDKLTERLEWVENHLFGPNALVFEECESPEWPEDPYEGEFELEEENEDNTEEHAMRVKKTVQEIGEVLFDIKGNISEGDYLKIMDGLQSITNEMN